MYKKVLLIATIMALTAGAVSAAVLDVGMKVGSNVRRTTDGALYQSVSATKSTYAPGEAITFVYTVTNNGDSAIVYNFRTGKQFDVWVTHQGQEVFRQSRGKMYTQMVSNLTLQPGASKEFKATWDPRKSGITFLNGPCVVHAQLQPSTKAPPEVTSSFSIGGGDDIVVPVTVSEAIRRSTELAGKNVSISAVYLGWKGDPNDANLKGGPPLTRGDWIITDSSGSMYVSGATDLDPNKDVGTRVNVIGKLSKTAKGQVYVVAQHVSVLK